MKLGESRKKGRLEELAASWRSCTDCELATMRTNVVFYRGNPDARLMIIGEAPGADEDMRGKPFVGKAGHVLNDLLLDAGIDPDEDVFVMNRLGCRPPNSRVPKREELKACAPRTEFMIKTVDPGAILLLGATAAKLAGVTSVGPWRGQPVEVELKAKKYRAVVTYHPSFLLRQGNSPKLARRVISDMKVARAISRGRKMEKDSGL